MEATSAGGLAALGGSTNDVTGGVGCGWVTAGGGVSAEGGVVGGGFWLEDVPDEGGADESPGWARGAEEAAGVSGARVSPE